MLISNEYALIYYPNRNQIIITLPQTWKTQTDTFSPVIDRRTDVQEIRFNGCTASGTSDISQGREERREDAEIS